MIAQSTYQTRAEALAAARQAESWPGFVRAIEAQYRRMWEDFRADRLPRPDLTNLDAYLDVGIALNPPARQGLPPPDPAAAWQAGLATRDAFATLAPDHRLWGRR